MHKSFRNPIPGVIAMAQPFSITFVCQLAALCVVMGASLSHATTYATETTVPVNFSGGHETDQRDGGRPVVLIAAGLGVKPEVFRDAFSRVRPARDGKPTGEEAGRNQEILMKALQ